MNIADPAISRLLAVLVQPIHAQDRLRFIKDSQKVKNFKEFLKLYKTYRKTNI
jgi:hypothetical protein